MEGAAVTLIQHTLASCDRLKSYEQQLAQVHGALSADPDNQELRNLESELKNLIDLTKQLLSTQGTSSGAAHSSDHTAGKGKGKTARQDGQDDQATTTAAHRFAVGDECQAKYEADGRWYPARVIAAAGTAQNPMYTILYKGYDQTEIVTSASLRPTTRSATVVNGAGGSGSSGNVKLTPEEEAERERKRRRSEKKSERFAGKAAEANAVQNSWQKFAKKAEKKGVLKKDKSMFKTPDDPLAKGKWFE